MDSPALPTFTSTSTAAAAFVVSNSDDNYLPNMFRPPINRSMRVLDRSFFKKTVPLSAATVFENKLIASVRNELARSRDLLHVPRIMAVRTAQDQGSWERAPLEAMERVGDGGDVRRKCLLLREGIRHDGSDLLCFSPSC
jgi:tRNA (guanine37-N1)-methyltransferase